MADATINEVTLISGILPVDGVYIASATGNRVVVNGVGDAILSMGDTYVKGIDVQCAVIVSAGRYFVDFKNKGSKPKDLSKKEVSAALIQPTIPNGTYQGRASGYVCQVTYLGEVFKFQMKEGIRGIDWPCMVTVHGDGTVATVVL